MILLQINGVPATPTSINVPIGSEIVVAGTVNVILEPDLTLSSSGGFLGGAVASNLPAFVGYDVSISGLPQAGDEFFIETGATDTGDNRNALALAALQTADVLNSGSASISDLYASLVGNVGNKAAAAQIDREAAQSI